MLPIASKRRFSRHLALACVLAASLAGCASQPSSQLKSLPQRVELGAVPFYRGVANQSAPMALAAILSQQGVRITPGLVEGALQLPQGADTLQGSMQTAARQYGMLVYPLDASLPAARAVQWSGLAVLGALCLAGGLLMQRLGRAMPDNPKTGVLTALTMADELMKIVRHSDW